MRIIVKGRHMDVGPELTEYAEEKVGKVGRILDHYIKEAEVELIAERNPAIENDQVAEVTLFTKGHVVRAKEAAPDMFAAIDMAADKLESQIRKYKGKLQDRHSARAAKRSPMPEPVLPDVDDGQVVKTKRTRVKAMSPDEAIVQLELLGHDFLVFVARETNEINVLYRRGDGDYGLIEPVRE